MKIICVKDNYRSSSEVELNNKNKSPLFFMKGDSCLQRDNRLFFIPDFCSEVQGQLNFVLRICKVGKGIAPEFAHRYYNGITAGIDFTAKDILEKCVENGFPWEMSKSFDQSARIGKWLERDDYSELTFWFKLNGELIQKINTSEMIRNFNEIVSDISQFMTLKMGDLIYTGTPDGSALVSRGDRLSVGINDEILLDFASL